MRALQAGDRVAEELIQRAVQALGVGIGSAVTLLDVEAVVDRRRPGRAARAGVARPDRGRPSNEHTFFRTPPVYRSAELGDLGGAIGASLLE